MKQADKSSVISGRDARKGSESEAAGALLALLGMGGQQGTDQDAWVAARTNRHRACNLQGSRRVLGQWLITGRASVGGHPPCQCALPWSRCVVPVRGGAWSRCVDNIGIIHAPLASTVHH